MLPRVAVIGSCVSRDAFNRQFYPDYKKRVQLVADAYQLAMPSLIRKTALSTRLPGTVRANHRQHLEKEMQGGVLEKIVAAKPDVVVVDLFADVHFGVTTIDGWYVTRNHMAFASITAATDFYRDKDWRFPERARFEDHSYRLLLEDAVEKLCASLPKAKLILNSARFSESYTASNGGRYRFSNVKRLRQKNSTWSSADDLFTQMTGCSQLVYPESSFVASQSHAWGLHPVHYAPEYYRHFWNELGKVANL